MKIKLLSLILAILCMTALLVSCGGDGSTDGGDNTGDTGNGDNTQTEIKGYIYDLELGVNPSVVCSPAERIPGTYTGVVRDTLRDLLGTYPSITPDTSDKVLHEIVIGPADRAISRKAYRELYLSTRDQDSGYQVIRKNSFGAQ